MKKSLTDVFNKSLESANKPNQARADQIQARIQSIDEEVQALPIQAEFNKLVIGDGSGLLTEGGSAADYLAYEDQKTLLNREKELLVEVKRAVMRKITARGILRHSVKKIVELKEKLDHNAEVYRRGEITAANTDHVNSRINTLTIMCDELCREMGVAGFDIEAMVKATKSFLAACKTDYKDILNANVKRHTVATSMGSAKYMTGGAI